MSRSLNRDVPLDRVHANSVAVGNEEQKPVLGGFQVYVGDFIGPNDPGNDPPDAGPDSPPWQNGFTYLPDAPLWFAHGVDGETDMGGAYDLITGSPVSGTVAFDMPLEWAQQAPPIHVFGVLIDDSGSEEDWVYTIAAQVINQTNGEVRVYWPLCADLCVT